MTNLAAERMSRSPGVASEPTAKGGRDERARVGVLISGRGSNMVALAEACNRDGFPARIAVVASNRPDAPGLEKAASFGIPVAVVDHKAFDTKAGFEAELARVLAAHGVEIVCLAGFMRVISEGFIRRYPQRILNIHPSLLPAFPGLHAQRQALEHGARLAGCTVHIVAPEVDAGPIVAQAAVPVQPDDTEESLAARILEKEHEIYPQALALLAEGRLRIEGRRVTVLPAAAGREAVS